jgi:hypothetical protein
MDLLADHPILVAIAIVVVASAIYTLVGRKRKAAPPSELTYAPGTAADPARDAFAAAADGEPPTEDQIARARLGGPRGAPELGQAPLAPQAREQMPRKVDDGHVA